MQLQCPCCSEQFPFEAGFADAEGKQLAALFAALEPKLGRAVLNYLRLFSPAKRSLRMVKAIRLVEELVALVNTGRVQCDARTPDFKPAPPRLWVAGIEQMIVQRDRLQLPLENHNYLRAVVWGIAADPAQVESAAPKEAVRENAAMVFNEAYNRIKADMLLGLIDEVEGKQRLAALQGGGL